MHPAVSLALLAFACSSPAPTATRAPAAAPLLRQTTDAPAAASEPGAQAAPGAPVEQLYPVLRVVDGDTLHIERDGERVKLRLLSVDTEEKLSGRSDVDPNKPETAFGQATSDWAQALFEQRAMVGDQMRVGLRFPPGPEQLDVYGRLLCHVLLPDGTDYNLLLVAEGMSPYFNKYGDSRVCEAEFRAAQERARTARLGIWNPDTNRATTPGAPSVQRPYADLLPWWEARAEAVRAFRKRSTAEPDVWIAADEPAALERAAEGSGVVQVFGLIDRFFDEDDGSLTLLMRSGDRRAALRAKIPAAAREAFDRAELEHRASAPYVQNYLLLRGAIGRDARGFELSLSEPDQLRVAAPDYPPAGDSPPRSR